GRELKARGATADNPATVMIGISTDEMSRANNRRSMPYETVTYPLLDLRLNRQACPRILDPVVLPIPPKSACWFCPFHSKATWQNMRTDDPDMFDRAAELEATLNRKRTEIGRDPVWLTDALIPLRDAVLDHDALPFDDDPDP